MDNYEYKMQKDSFNELINYYSSETTLQHFTGNTDEITFGSTSSHLVPNSNNPFNIAIFLEKDDGFDLILTNYGNFEEFEGIAVLKYDDLDLLPYSIDKLSEIEGDRIEEIETGIKYKFSGEYTFYKIGEKIIGLIFNLDKV